MAGLIAEVLFMLFFAPNAVRLRTILTFEYPPINAKGVCLDECHKKYIRKIYM